MKLMSRHAERNPSILSSTEASQPIVILGICGGLLSAAAAAVSRNIAELIEVGSFLAGITCRVAVAISRRAVEIDDENGSWAFTAMGDVVSQLPTILEQFNRNQV